MKSFLIMILFLLGINIIQAQTTVLKTLGNTEVYTLTSVSVNARAIPVTFTDELNQIKSISIYHTKNTGNMLVGVYSDNNGSPNVLLATSAVTLVANVTGWQTVNLINPIIVNKDQTVWLAWIFQNSVVVRHTASTTTKRATSKFTWTETLPTSYGIANLALFKFSVYCNYTTDILSNKADSLEYENYLKYCLTPAPRVFYLTGALDVLKVNGYWAQPITGAYTADFPLKIKWNPIFSKSDTINSNQYRINVPFEVMVTLRYPPSIDDFYKWWKTGFIQGGMIDSKTIPLYDFTR
jgi:hypothetical protein